MEEIEVGFPIATKTLEERFEKFLKNYYYKDILRVIRGYPEERSLIVDFDILDNYDFSLAEEVINNPDEAIKACEKAIRNMELPIDLPSVKINVRFQNLPSTHKFLIRELRSNNVGKLISVEGIVRKSTDVRPKLVIGAFECQVCGNIIRISQDGDKLKQPYLCDSCERKGPFNLLIDESVFIDSQKILIQESLEDLRGGEHPQQLTVYLEDDLTGKIFPGDRIEVVGILRTRRNKKTRVFDIFMEANSFKPIETDFEEITITKEDEERILELSKNPKIYEMVRDSIAPHIYGYREIKEAIMYQLFSSPPLELPDGGKIRGDSHIIIIGEPATGKSEILQYVAKELAPRGVYTSGKGTSSAGLTAAAIKDEFGEGGWSLEAGALVLADKGIACLTPDSKVIVNNKIVRIEEILNEKKKFKALCNGEEVEICDLNLKTVSLNPDLKTVYSDSTYIRRKKYFGKLLELKFGSGFKIRLTPDHKLLDGNIFKWKEAKEFRKGDFVVAPLKIPENNEDIYLLDIIPEDWIVILSKKDKKYLKEIITKKYKTLSDFNKKYNLPKDFLSGKSQIKVGKLRKILQEFSCYEEWKEKIIGFGRKSSGERFKTAKITPELAYFLGFIYGNGSVAISKKNSRLSITQSEKNKLQIETLKKCFESFSGRKLGLYRRKCKSIIRGKKIESDSVVLYSNSNLLAYLFDYFTKENLRNILKLPDESLKAFIAGCLDSDGCVSIKRSRGYKVAHIEFQLSNNEESDLNFILALRRFDIFAKLVKETKINKIIITGREDVKSLLNAVKKYSVKAKNIPIRKHKVSSYSNKLPSRLVAEICDKIAKSVSKTILVKRGLWSTIHAYKNEKYRPSREQLLKIASKLSRFLNPEIKEKISILASRDYFLDKIVEIKEIKYHGDVYDLYIPKYHNFFCNGIIVHNCIDEFDKMDASDRSAMHEAMEQQTVSIAKAGILATFRARCSILAAANPKYGRFDEYRPISEQINLPPTILSRFDLIFFVRDELEETREIARHILDTVTQTEKIAPKISPELLRKYISYARQRINPRLTEEARKRIEEFYVEMREVARDSKDVPIPLTARQLWAIIRIARASARVRLSNNVTLDDVERAIRLVKLSLKQAGVDLETGKFDIDKIMVGVTKSQRDKIKAIIDIIKELEEEFGTAKKVEIIEKAKELGISRENVEELLQKLKRDGSIYEPKHEHYKVVS